MTYATGFTYNAGLHCHDCTTKRFGPPADAVSPWVGVTDSEGNEVGTVFPTTEFDYAPTCEDCGEEINAVDLSATGEVETDASRDGNWHDRGAQEHWHDIESGALLVSEDDLDGLEVEACYAGPCEEARQAIERVADGEIEIPVCGCGATITDTPHNCPADNHIPGCACADAYDKCPGSTQTNNAKGAPSPTRPGH